MNPPEKIWLSATFPSSFGTVQVISDKREFDTDIEYHLAPVWHDAKTDPPKESGDYLTARRTQNYNGFQDVIWYNKDSGNWMAVDPDYWMPLPEPQKEEN